MYGRTKHVANRYQFIRQCVEEGSIELIWIEGTETPADSFSKTLAGPAWGNCFDRMRVAESSRC